MKKSSQLVSIKSSKTWQAIGTSSEAVSFSFYEFKSVSVVPPSRFAEQFLKDLLRADVTNLDQIRWIFDGRKIPVGLDGKAFKAAMEEAIDKLDLTENLAEKFIGSRNVSRLKKHLKDNLEKTFIITK